MQVSLSRTALLTIADTLERRCDRLRELIERFDRAYQRSERPSPVDLVRDELADVLTAMDELRNGGGLHKDPG